MDELVEDEINRLSKPVEEIELGSIDATVLRKPLTRLFSKDAISVDVGQSIGEALQLMRDNEYGAVCVTQKGKLAGILTERDLVTRVFGVVDKPLEKKVGEVMTPAPVSLQASDAIIYACHNLHVGGYRHLPVVDDEDRPVSIVSIKDVFRYLLGYFQQEVSNVTDEPYRGPRSREGA